MILTLAAFAQIAAPCGSSVHLDTLASVARTESRFNTLAIGDNTSHRAYAPSSVEQAVTTASALLNQGHSLDLGLMQINSTNLRGLGLTIADTFDACKNIAGGARILVAGYRPNVGEGTQPALLRALSRYNTGSDRRGFINGYVQRVQLAAQQVVPAIRLDGTAVMVRQEGGEAVATTLPPPPAPPTWNVYARARYRQRNGDAPVPPVAAAPADVPGQPPVMLQSTRPTASND
jgi:type IV secretion system protein VirB1